MVFLTNVRAVGPACCERFVFRGGYPSLTILGVFVAAGSPQKRWLPEVAVTGKALEEKTPLGILFAFKVRAAYVPT